jgi:hypothetical protein
MANFEGRIVLALDAYQKNHFRSLRAAASAYDIPRITLARRLKETPLRSDFVSLNLKFTQTEEAIFIQWILFMDTRGISLT